MLRSPDPDADSQGATSRDGRIGVFEAEEPKVKVLLHGQISAQLEGVHTSYRRLLANFADVDGLSLPFDVQRVKDIPNRLLYQRLKLLLPRNGVRMRQAQTRPPLLLGSQSIRPRTILPQALRRSRRMQLARLPHHRQLLGTRIQIGIVGSPKVRRRKRQVAQPDTAQVAELAISGEETGATGFS